MASHAKLALLALTIAAAFAGTPGWAADPGLDGIRTMLREGKAAQAYALLEPQEFERAGDVEFDTLLGVAALDGGKPDKATLAFERVLAVQPNAAGVRLDMARAYFALGDYPRARQELETVAQNNPPPAARLVIDKYLNAIAERERAKRTVITGYLEGFAGYDDNITSVVGDFTSAVLATYNLPGFQPTGNAVKRSSALAGAAGGVDINHQIDETWSVSGSADLRHRAVLKASNYSSNQLDLRAGLTYAAGQNIVRGGLTLQGYRQRTDVPSADRNAVGLNAEWRHIYGPSDQTSVFAVLTRQRFPDISVNNMNSVAFGAGWLHLFDGARKPLLYLTAVGGQDNARESLANGADNGKRFVLGRVYGQIGLSETAEVFASLGLLYRKDSSAYARSSIVANGNDHVRDVTLGWNWRPAPEWTVRPQVTYSENRSNVALSEYKRTEATVSVRYDFR
ncbi:MAG TPA: tetratricopeptide repeat protein [Paucimonas sp.]|nr:tetratricopeptide repeat protein [Paucimonas sp.]